QTIEVVLHERSDQRERIPRRRFVRRADRAALEILARECRVTAEHTAAGLRQIHNERLMTGRVPRRRHDLEPGGYPDASGDRHVRELGNVPVHAREVRLALRECEVIALDYEGRLRGGAVVAGVVETQVAGHAEDK